MADAFLYSFVSIASTTLIESVSYNIIRNLIYFTLIEIQLSFATEKITQQELHSI